MSKIQYSTKRMKTWQGYLEDDGGRRPGHLVLYPIEVGRLVHNNSKFKTSPGVSWWRSGLTARLLPGHICSHWRNQELSPDWETDHIVFKSNGFPLCRTKAIVAKHKLSSYCRSVVACIRFSWIQCYSYMSLHFLCPVYKVWNGIIPIRTFGKKWQKFLLTLFY